MELFIQMQKLDTENFFNDSTLESSGGNVGFADTMDLPPSTQDLNEEFKFLIKKKH